MEENRKLLTTIEDTTGDTLGVWGLHNGMIQLEALNKNKNGLDSSLIELDEYDVIKLISVLKVHQERTGTGV